MACSANISFHFCLIWQYHHYLLRVQSGRHSYIFHVKMHNTPLMFQLDFFNVFYGPVSGLQHICMLWRVKKKEIMCGCFFTTSMWWQTSLLCRRHLSGDVEPKSHLAAWQRMSLICDFQFAVMSPLDAVLQQRCPYWHHCFFVFFSSAPEPKSGTPLNK